MKKIISFILTISIFMSLMTIVALAENDGPAVHTLPALVDFETEEEGLYYVKEKVPKTFYNIASFNRIKQDEITGNKYLAMTPTPAVSSKNVIMFEDFKYDPTAPDGVQPTKLVITFDAEYEKITNSAANIMSTDYIHFGVANTTAIDYGVSATHEKVFNLYYSGIGENSIGTIGYMSGGSGHGFVASALNNHAYKDLIKNGSKIKYTFVLDLTRNAKGNPSMKFYINDIASPTLTYDGKTEVNSVNSVIFGASKNCIVNIDNVNIFEVPNGKIAFAGTNVSGNNVSLATREILFNFSSGITSAADKYISVFKGETELTQGTDYTIEPYFKDNEKTPKAFKVVFPKTLDAATTYTVKADKEYFGADGSPIGEETTLTTFTTQVDPISGFDVVQTAGIRAVYGVSGIGMLAYFDGAPGEIYVAREVRKAINLDDGYPSYLTSCIAKVTDPNGRIAAVYDFADMDEIGREFAVLNITDNIPGIWKIQIMNGRGDDKFTIGINDTDIWGIRGEKILGASTTIPNECWIYTQDTLDYFYAAVSANAPFTLYDANGNEVATSEATTRSYIKQQMKTSDVKPETAYKIKWKDGFVGNIEIDGVPGLLCPTKEAAETLKGGWLKEGNVTVQGAFQKRAREEIKRLISTKNLDYTYKKPASLPTDLKNPMAEAQLYGGYGIITGIYSACQNQILDFDSPYLGLMDGKPVEVPELNWQYGHYKEMSAYADGPLAMASVACQLDLETNYLYGKDALIQRSAIGLLGIMTQLSEDDGLRSGDLSKTYTLMTQAMFTFEPMASAYVLIRNRVDPETREVLDQGMMTITDKMCNYVGQGPTNQALFCMSLCERMYRATGIERYHDTFKRQIKSLLENTDQQHGQAKAGYFLEAHSCDASYEYMNKYHFYSIYKHYKTNPDADQQLIADMKVGIDKNLEFESFFWAPQPYSSTVDSLDPSNFTSRTVSVLGSDNYPGYSMIWDEFPMARRRQEMVSGNKLAKTGTGGYPQRVNNEDWAYKYIEGYWEKYDKFYATGYGLSGWPTTTYYAFNATDWVEPAENLPFESADGSIWEKDGLVAFKHKGIYGVVFYGIDNSNSAETDSWMGGGPTFLWAEGAGKTLLSKKHANYHDDKKLKSADDITTSCVFGVDASGNLTFCSGKEGTVRYKGLGGIDFKWNTYGKNFTISGLVPDGNNSKTYGETVYTDKTVSWNYALNNTGVALTAMLENGSKTDKNYLNLPIPVGDANIKTEFSTGKLVVKNGTGSMTYTWDASLEASFAEQALNDVKNLRIRLPLNGRVTVNISAASEDFTISEMALYKDIQIGDRRLIEILKSNDDAQYLSYRIRNNTNSEKKAKMIIARYESAAKLAEILEIKELTLAPDSVTRVMSDALDLKGKTGEIRAFVWTEDGKVKPLVPKNDWTIDKK